MRFSIVIPVKDEAQMLWRTLPSCCRLKPDELVLCFDKPAPWNCLQVVKEVTTEFPKISVKILELERNPEYMFHQAWVRRKGFLEATNDVILTVDVDVIVNKNVLKTVGMVGEDNIGLVSCSKFRYPISLVDLWRCMGRSLLWLAYRLILWRISASNRDLGMRMTTFTGLYALYRPYWLDSEDGDVKRLVNPKQGIRGERVSVGEGFSFVGEDTYLRDCMEKKHRVVCLEDIGGVTLSKDLHSHPSVQFERGRYSFRRKRSLLGAILHSVLHAEPHFLEGFLYEKARMIIGS